MAETVLSMARSLVGSAISKAASAAAQETSLLIGVQRDIWYIKDELRTMQAFLRAAEVMEKKDDLLEVWAGQVRDLSYNIEDCLDEYKVHVESRSLLRKLVKLRERHRIAIRIRNLKARVEEVSNRNTRYSLIKPISSSTEDERDSSMEDIRNHSARNVDEAELVGFANRKEELLQRLEVHVKDGPPVKVICVVGMGGIGKTALCRKIFESKEDVANHFSCNAFVTVSQSLDRLALLNDMLKQVIMDPKSLEELQKDCSGKGAVAQVNHLAERLMKELKEKRYFIVLDDLWTIHAWKWIIRCAVPIENDKGSRIVITTRNTDLASECIGIPSSQLIYHVERLKMEDAITLLLRTTKKEQKDMEDKNMKKIVELVVKKCGYHPLAILTIGAVLATKKEVSDWKQIYNQLPVLLETNPSLEALRRMVSLSYNHLPSYLKPCFLYLSIFPEDFEIQKSCLVERWIAEGFVRGRVGMTLEDMGESYFIELINRSMIQPSRVGVDGTVRGCRVHDIVRDITVSISREQSFVCYIEDVTNVAEENFRHIVCNYPDGQKCPKLGMDWSHVRSLTVFGDERPMDLAPSLYSPQFRMLRALDLYNARFPITQKEINNIGVLRHLKYLRLHYKEFEIYKLPRSIEKLRGLQYLNIRESCILALPTGISKLQSLRSLRCTISRLNKRFYLNQFTDCLTDTLRLPVCWGNFRSFGYPQGVRMPRGIGNLRELQRLEVVDIKRTSSKAIQGLGKLTQLRKLRVETSDATEQNCKILCAAIDKLASLRSLRVDNQNWKRGTLQWLNCISSPPHVLRSLKLRGYLGEMPDWVRDLTHLTKILLEESELKEENTMEILGALPNLMLLNLEQSAYVGEKLVFRAGAFLSLRKLHIGYQDQLTEVRFEKDTSPQMETIEIRGCKLKSGIIGISHLEGLKEIHLESYCEVPLAVLQKEVDTHPKHPVLRLQNERSAHDLGDVEGSN